MLEGYGVWVIVRKVTKQASKDGSYNVSEVAKLVGETEYFSDAIKVSESMTSRGKEWLWWNSSKLPTKVMSEELSC